MTTFIKKYYQTNLFYFLAFASVVNGAIISGEINLSTGQGIAFDNKSAKIISDSIYNTQCGYDLYGCCENNMIDSVDISYFNTLVIWDDFLCCGGNMTGIRLNDTIWFIRNISLIDFSKKLELNDTSIFKMNNLLVKYNSSCHTWVGISPAPGGKCCTTYEYPQYSLIMKTRAQKYLLFRIISEQNINSNNLINDIYLARIKWFLQLDGTTNFNGINLSINKSKNKIGNYFKKQEKLEFIWEGKRNTSETHYFDCLGRKVRLPYGNKWKSNQILIKIK